MVRELLLLALYSGKKIKNKKIKFLTKPQNLEVLEGEKAEFFCSVSKEAITVQWLRGDTVLEAGDKYDIISDGKKRTLVVKDSILGDAGKYTVMVGEAKATARLTVIGKLYFINVQVHILLIITPLKDQEVNEGQEIIFNCEVNKEGAKEKWYKNDEAIFDSAKYIIVQKDLVYTLRIRDAQLKDQATYTISLSNKRGEHAKSSAALTINQFGVFILTEEDLRIIEPLEDIETMEKKTVTFWCKVNRLNATLKWTKNGEEITFNKRILYKIDKYKHSLIIKDCGFVDEGEYTVTAGQDKSVAELLITEAPADFIEHLRDQTVTEFDDAVFTCQLSKEKASVRWYRNGREIKEGKKYQFEKDGNLHRLIIKDCRLDDECEYSCGVDDRKSRARLFVEGMCRLNRIYIYEAPGADVIFMAELNKDGVEVKWLRNNMIIVQGDKHQMMSEGKVHRLQVCEIKPRDQGEYRFIAKDKEARAKLELAGKLLAFVSLTMFLFSPKSEAPEIFLDVKLLAGLTVKAGTKIELPAKVTGKPEPQVTWTKADKILRPDDRITIETKPNHSTVTITDSKRSDSGTYIIEAVNSSGRQKINIHILSSTDKPGPPAAFDVSEITNESCLLTWNPPRDDGGSKITNYVLEKRATDSEIWHKLSSTIKDTKFRATNLTPHKEYVFRVSAENMYGIGEPAQCNPPGPPTGLKPTEVTKDSVTLTWNEPDEDGGSPITGYWVERYDPEQDKWIKLAEGVPTTEHFLKGLMEKQEYSFRVRAVNKAGESEPSEPSDPVLCKERLCEYCFRMCCYCKYTVSVFKKAPCLAISVIFDGITACFTFFLYFTDPPSPPRWLEVINITKNTADLKWTVPEKDGGSPITNYIVEKRDVRRKGWQTVDTTVKDTKYTVSPLTEGSLYVFRVAAENAIGQSDYFVAKDPDCKNKFFLFQICITEKKNRVWQLSSNIILTFTGNPTIDLKTRDIVVVKGQKLRIPIPFRAVPSPTITWHKDGKELKAGDRTTMKSDYTSALLEVIDSVHADAGVYTITLENKLASTTGSVNVKVIGN
uniref:Titin n=1 Tax=Bubo bubo TaxID=30461 RepID=A0A8C0EK92_BUBBB